MTTIVIHNGTIYTDTKSSIIDEKSSGGATRQWVLDNIHTEDEDIKFGIEAFINSRYVDDYYKPIFPNGKFMGITNNELIIPGENVKGLTFAGFANYPIYAEFFLKEKTRTLQELVDKFSYIDKKQYEKSTEYYKDNEEMCSTIREHTYCSLAVVTDKGTHVLCRKNALSPEDGFISIFFPKEDTIVMGSGPNMIKGLERCGRYLANNDYREFFTEKGIYREDDIRRYMELASKIDEFTNNEIKVL